jgi:hypothetical protein
MKEESMGMFSKFFSRREALLTRNIFSNARKKVDAIGDLALAIGRAGFSCGEAMKPHVHYESEDKITEQWIYVCFEFMYFFAHMTDRVAFAQLGYERREKLLAILGPLIAEPAIEAFFGHWPDDLKAKMLSEFYQKMNDAQLDYSTCHELISKDNPITGNALFSKLARNVAELCGDSPTDPAAHIVPYGVAIEAWGQLHLDKHIEAVEKVL